jgi:hypothetical protein
MECPFEGNRANRHPISFKDSTTLVAKKAALKQAP